MRLATITNWAYGATVALTLASGVTMLQASNAHQREREAVEQRYQLDKATSRLGTDVYALSDHARQYLNTGDPTYRVLYRSDVEALASVEERIAHLGDAGADRQELAALADAIRGADTLHAEQEAALAAFDRGDEWQARQILFGAEYERELDHTEAQIVRFQDRLDRRIGMQLEDAAEIASWWRLLSEIMLAVTGLLFLCVLYFVFKQRVLHPVVKLSDVIGRFARQDFDAELPEISQIDEIGDMAQAIRVFRENGLERQRLESERDADRAIRDLLARMTQRMQGCDTLADLQRVVQRFVPEIAPTRAGRLYLVDKRRNAVVEACEWLDPASSARDFAAGDCWALRRGMSHRPAGGAVDVPCPHIESDGGQTLDTLCLPLIAQRETLGLLYFEPLASAGNAAETPTIYLGMLAENIGLALANLRLREALREMAMVDPLTQLANRRQLDAMLDGEIRELAGQGMAVACLMIDVDHFKRFNDTYGHDAGDAVLREVGAVLQSATREGDFSFRYGGEEFLMLLPGLEPEQAAERAQDIRGRIAALSLSHDGNALGAITASIGVACAPRHCPPERLVQTADAALFCAKEGGRNRVELPREGTKTAAA